MLSEQGLNLWRRLLETSHCGQCCCTTCSWKEHATQSDFAMHLPAVRHADSAQCGSLEEGLQEWQNVVAVDDGRFCTRGHKEK